MKILLNEQEQEALSGLPHLACCLYIKAIKPRMDIATGLVGVVCRISWKALSEWLYVEPHPGIKSGAPSVNQLRRSVIWLQKAGVIQNLSKGKQLIFKCLLASQPSYIPKKADSKPADKSADFNDAKIPEFYAKTCTGDLEVNSIISPQADIHHITRTNTKTIPLKDECSNFSFGKNEIPESSQHWVSFFTQEMAFPSETIFTVKTLSLFDYWCQEKISIEVIRQAITAAHQVLGRKPDSPTYYRNFVEEWLNSQRRLEAQKSFRFKSPQEYRHGKNNIPKTAAERMWAACQSGLKGSVFE